MAHAFLKAGEVIVRQRCIKVAWPSRRDAFKALKKHRNPSGLAASGSGTMQVYKCKICRQYHLGHKRHQ